MWELMNYLKCLIGLHLFEERSEAVKCVRGCGASIGLKDWRIGFVRYARTSRRRYKGRK